jgi:gliding motility-associated-like protein
MKKLLYQWLGASLLIVWMSISVQAQVTVELTVTGGIASTTCDDPFSGPDPLWEVNIENQGWVTYPEVITCFTALPNLQYSESYSCPNDLPATIEVCFQAFENDPLLPPPFSCDIDPSCLETICMDFDLDFTGTNSLTLSLPAGGASEGSVDFDLTITDNASAPNDPICSAEDMGVLDIGDSYGDPNVSTYSNVCGTSSGEPSPADQWGSWFNNVGLWWTFTTGPNEIPYFVTTALSDPSNLGDPVSLQIAIFEADDGTCDGDFTLISQGFDAADFDEINPTYCLAPNTVYYILIDGNADSAEELRGVFGLGVDIPDVASGGDLKCDHEDLGMIPDGGSVQPGLRTNRCASNAGDPFGIGFFPDRTVWFSFQPPPTGHINIDITSDQAPPLGIDAIDIEMALFSTSDNTCNGTYQLVQSSYTGGDFNESMEVSCLDPNQTYYLMVDGKGGVDSRGVFDLVITDAGDETVITDQDVTLCAGTSLFVGSMEYTTSGMYTDTLSTAEGCDSIVNTNLTVLDPLFANISFPMIASAGGLDDGSALASPTGGQSPYTFLWSTNETTAQIDNLIGGDNYCVTITDNFGCEIDTCFEQAFQLEILPTVTQVDLDCNGDGDGAISIQAIGGQPPYSFDWVNTTTAQIGSGNIPGVNIIENITNLDGGLYSITLTDGMTDTIFQIDLIEPEEITFNVLNQNDISCFDACDGFLAIEAVGGTAPFSYFLDGNATPVLNNLAIAGLCAGNHEIEVVDANNCSATYDFSLSEPAEFIADITVNNDVSCFGGSDASITATTNGNATAYLWNTLDNTPTITGLPQGMYTVTVTDDNGCKDTTSVTITQPATPLAVTIDEIQPVSCAGEDDGILEAIPVGPGTIFTYTWSDFNNNQQNDDLFAGTYSVTVVNENGCDATADYTLTEPDPLIVSIATQDLTCVGGPDSGAMEVEDVQGGEEPYLYSVDGAVFANDSLFESLSEGGYNLVVQDALGCEQIVPFQIFGAPELEIDLGDDLVIELGQTIELDAAAIGDNLVYTWILTDQDYQCATSDCQSIFLTPTATTTVAVAVNDTTSLCVGADQILIQVANNRKIYIPNTFSPNFDGINDYFMVFAKQGVQRIARLDIFDRFGGQIYSRTNLQPNDEQAGWDGTYRGKRVQTGVYVFFVEIEFIDGDVQLFKGDVLVVD